MDFSEPDALGAGMTSADDVLPVRPDLDHAIPLHRDREPAERFTESAEGGVKLSHGGAAEYAMDETARFA